MTHYRSFTADDAVRAAEAALSRLGGGTVTIGEVRDLGGDERRNLIVRASAVDPGGVATPVIIKATRAAGYDPAAETVYETAGLAREWVAAALLAGHSEKSGQHGALLAADVAQGVLVFRDYGEDAASLVRPLLHGTAEDAEQALIAYARALARLHVTTIGCREGHAAIVRSGFPAARLPRPGHGWIDREPRKVLSLLGRTLPDDELTVMAKRLKAPGPWLALVHRDPCPDNVLLASDGTATLIDFEFAGPGHALLDAVYWRMGFPTCWCAGRVPDTVSERIDAAYRSAVADVVPAAADQDAFQREQAIVGAIWLFGSLAWLLEGALKEDTDWGISSNRSRILHYLTAAIQMTADADVLPGTRQTAAAWLDDLRDRWHGCATLALYPAFTRAEEQGAQTWDQ
jgi:aminoglycoside/choline kinase family phosphotransferase